MADGYVCPECGLDYDTVAPSDAAAAGRSFPRRYREALDGQEDDVLRRRPAPETWSALEYTAHVGDVIGWLADIVRAMTTQDDPTLDFPDPDEVARERRYNEQEVATALESVRTASEHFASVVDGVAAGDWGRTAVFPWGDRDALTMARNAVHEGVHHLRDIERGLREVNQTS